MKNSSSTRYIFDMFNICVASLTSKMFRSEGYKNCKVSLTWGNKQTVTFSPMAPESELYSAPYFELTNGVTGLVTRKKRNRKWNRGEGRAQGAIPCFQQQVLYNVAASCNKKYCYLLFQLVCAETFVLYLSPWNVVLWWLQMDSKENISKLA